MTGSHKKHFKNLIYLLPFFLVPSSSLIVPKTNKTRENGEDPAVHVKEYSTALINVSWVDAERTIIHSDVSETGRFSNAGASTVSGILAIAHSEVDLSQPDIDTQFGCIAPLYFTNRKFDDGAPIIALLKRGGCVFDKKVENAEAAGAVGIIIYNDKEEEQLRTIAVSYNRIPVVFTYDWKGKQLVDLVEEEKTVFLSLEEGSHCQQDDGNSSDFFTCVRTKNYPGMDTVNSQVYTFTKDTSVMQEEEMEHSWAIVLVSISFLILIMISLGWLLFYHVQRIRAMNAKDAWERKGEKQAKRALNSVKLVVVDEIEKEGEKECMVCLDTLQKGEEVRCLPCDHTFHRKCIDDWLLSRRKCPLCNLNIVQYFGLEDGLDTDMESDQSDTIQQFASE